MENVEWRKAVEFCKQLSARPEEKKAGRSYRLPSEAEWEYACRAGTSTGFNLTDSLSSKQANFNGKYPVGGAEKGPYLRKTAKVGSYEHNAFGLYDMHGNVWEWIADRFGAFPIGDFKNPKGPDRGNSRVMRGGSWNLGANYCTVKSRNYESANYKASNLGVRLLLEPK